MRTMKTHLIVNAHLLPSSIFVSYLACGALAYTAKGEQREATVDQTRVTCSACRKVSVALAAARTVEGHIAAGASRIDAEFTHSRDSQL
jgi:hypothetical protein